MLDGAAFYLMEPVDGFNPTVEMPALHAGDPAVRHAMGLNAVDAVARLGAVDHVAVGLGDIGKPDGFLERQVPRWISELEGYRSMPGYPGPEIPGVDDVAAWLTANQPTSWTPGLMHGDYHMANLMFERTSPEVAAIVDWEMVTVGDPLLDFGWLLATGQRTGAAGGGIGELPTSDEMIEHYAARTTRDTSNARWYTVLACFKLGIVLEGSHARAHAGKAPKAIGDMLHATCLALFEQAHELITEHSR